MLKQKTDDSIVIRITGDSGDGVQLVGEQLTISVALSGRDVRTLPDFPAEIRAPSGTVAGVSGFQLAMSESALFTAGESLDVLVAMNPAALKNALQYLNQDGLLIINEDSLQDKDWEKANISPAILDEAKAHHQVLSIPLITYTLQALGSLEISRAEAKKSKNFYILGLILWLFDLETEHSIVFIQKKFKRSPITIEANQRALMAGYNYGMTLELSRRPYMMGEVNREPGDYRQITGTEAVALAMATLAVKTQLPTLIAGYPITPSSAILHECAKLEDFGLNLFQAEDEIAAICACLGAAFGGGLALTCTSGPGMDLKSEALGLGIVSELPLVLLNVQRAGASTGLPTKTGQSDLYQALYGRHGEAPLPVIAPIHPADCFYAIIEAFSIAISAMTPVIVLMDAYLAIAAQPWKIPEIDSLVLPKIEMNRFKKPYQRDEWLSRSWNIPGTPGLIHQLGGLEKQGDDGHVSYDPSNHQQMVHIRSKKIANVAKNFPPLHIEGNPHASILLIGWGSTYGSLEAATLQCQAEGIAIALLQLRHLSPLPRDLGDVIRSYSSILVAELNEGQLCQILRSKYLVDAKAITQSNGQPFSPEKLVQMIKENCDEWTCAQA